MSIDVDALLNESVVTRVKCGVCMWLDARPPDERAKWESALEQPKTFPASQIARAMGKVDNGDVKTPLGSSIQNHRAGHIKGRTSE